MDPGSAAHRNGVPAALAQRGAPRAASRRGNAGGSVWARLDRAAIYGYEIVNRLGPA
jgi:hypothetical protein